MDPEHLRIIASSRLGYAYDDLEPEIVTLRLSAVADQPTAPVTGGAPAAPVAATTREAWDAATSAMVAHKVLPFATIRGGIKGPALLSQPGATVLIGSDARAERKPGGWLAITLEARS